MSIWGDFRDAAARVRFGSVRHNNADLGDRRFDLLAVTSADDERASWSALLATQTPEQRLQTARENLLYLGAYGYDIYTGKSLRYAGMSERPS